MKFKADIKVIYKDSKKESFTYTIETYGKNIERATYRLQERLNIMNKDVKSETHSIETIEEVKRRENENE